MNRIKQLTLFAAIVFLLFSCRPTGPESSLTDEIGPKPEDREDGYKLVFILDDLSEYTLPVEEGEYHYPTKTSYFEKGYYLVHYVSNLVGTQYQADEQDLATLKTQSIDDQKIIGIVVIDPRLDDNICYFGSVQPSIGDGYPIRPKFKCNTLDDFQKFAKQASERNHNKPSVLSRGRESVELTNNWLLAKASEERRQAIAEARAKRRTMTKMPAVPEKLFNKDVARITLYNEGADGRPHQINCPAYLSPYWKTADTKIAIHDIVRRMKFDASCLWDTVQATAARPVANTIGYAWGSVIGVGSYVGFSYVRGQELVVIKVPGQDSLMVGTVAYRGFDFGLGLPGGSLTQSAIRGRCPEGIFSYLGWFETTSALANSNSEGKDNFANWANTGCDSWSITRGTTTPFIGVTDTYYWQVSDFVVVDGPRIKGLLDYMKANNPNLP